MQAFRALGSCLLAATAVAGCGAGPARQGPNGARVLPSYAGRQAQLFDDVIEPAAVGLDLDRSFHAKSDPKLRELAQSSDAVMRVRVTTVTAKTDGPEVVYQIGLHTVEKLSGANPPTTDFSVQVTKASESHGILKNFESRLVGYPFVAFVHEFVRPDGDRELHFHLDPDTKDVKAAVADALLLEELAR